MIIGTRFERWTVIGGEVMRNYRRFYPCRCDCGTERLVFDHSLLRGVSKSCGCYQRDRIVEVHTKQGMASSSEYTIWHDMIRRCEDPRRKDYPRYGGRGIWYTLRWLKFENFLADMGERPEGKTLDRIDNDGPYMKKNCRWATAKEQAKNQRPRTLKPSTPHREANRRYLAKKRRAA